MSTITAGQRVEYVEAHLSVRMTNKRPHVIFVVVVSMEIFETHASSVGSGTAFTDYGVLHARAAVGDVLFAIIIFVVTTAVPVTKIYLFASTDFLRITAVSVTGMHNNNVTHLQMWS